MELQKLLNENDIEIFRVVGTKANQVRFSEAMKILGDEWEVKRNRGENEKERDGIWIGWKKSCCNANII